VTRLAAVLVPAGGLLLAGATGADWVREEVTREVGGVPVTEVETTPGTTYAPVAFRNGLIALAGGLGMLLLRGTAKRIVGAAATALGVLGGWAVATGWREAAADPGEPSAAIAFAGIGALAVVVGGLHAAMRPAPPPTLGARYSIDEDEADDEWDAAAGDEPPTMPS
jgi:hypothetical protein